MDSTAEVDISPGSLLKTSSSNPVQGREVHSNAHGLRSDTGDADRSTLI